MKKLLLMVAAMAPLLVGCISGGAAKVGTTELVIQRGTNVYKLRNPKDTSIDSFKGHPDGSFELIGLRTTVNEGLVRTAQLEAQALHDERKTMLDMFDRGAQAAGARYGVNVPPATVSQPMPQYPLVTNGPVVVPATVVLTNAPAK
jgi:hypothetical protein